MICVSVGRGRHRMMIAEVQHLAEKGVELVELRLDYIRRPVNLKRLLADRPCPVVATCRRPQEGGKWTRTESDRLMLLRTAIADGADYVDLEHDIASRIPRYGSTKRIISYHNFEETPDHLDDIYTELTRLDPDIIKITTMANNPMDNVRVLRLCRDAEIPTAAFCMGEMGLPSRILCGRFGSPLTYATFHPDRVLAPGQLSYEEMVGEYRYDEITEATRVLGVIGDPIEHSFSPRVHNSCLRKANLDMVYLPFRVQKQYLDDFFATCPEMGIKGLSVTIPHKETVLRCCNALDDAAGGIRAVNTVVFRDQNAFGFNTDCDAAIESLEAALRETPDQEKPLAGKRVLLLGAGGVARALAFGLKQAQAQVTITARDHRKGDMFAAEMDCQSIDWPARQNFDCQVLVNCTPVGMFPNLDESPFEGAWFNKKVLVFDTVYNPEQTLFIKQARQAECRTVTGIDMFVRQAARQFRLFTGQEPDEKLIRYEIKRATSAARY